MQINMKFRAIERNHIQVCFLFLASVINNWILCAGEGQFRCQCYTRKKVNTGMKFISLLYSKENKAFIAR